MSYSLSFSPEFFSSEDEFSAERPFTVEQAIAAMPEDRYAELAREVFGVEPEFLAPSTVMDKIRETDSCGTLGPGPVDVWIDAEGWFTVDVYSAPRHIPDLDNGNLPLCGNETQGETVAWLDRHFVANCPACKALLDE